jgi:predicted thioesterase
VAPEPGLRAEVTLRVTHADTALAIRSGDVPVLATPRLLALCEEATVAAVAEALEDGKTTVGMRVQLDHVNPTPVGATVRAEAVLEKVEGPRLTFTISAHDDRGLIGIGRVTRVMVGREKFLQRLRDENPS